MRVHLGRYAAGLQGLGVLRRWLTDAPAVGAERARALAALVDRLPGDLASAEVEIAERAVVPGYTEWAASYDALPNPLIDIEQPAVRSLLEALPPGDALDAACGTGRWAAWLAAAGHRVVGVDATPAMLAHARRRVPAATFLVGTVEALPVAAESMDLAVCALALQHVADLGSAFATLARVVRPGGRVVATDLHPTMLLLGGGAFFVQPDGGFGLVASRHRGIGEYVAAAACAGLRLRTCVEPCWGEVQLPLLAGPLWAVAPDAVRDAFLGMPGALVVELERG